MILVTNDRNSLISQRVDKRVLEFYLFYFRQDSKTKEHDNCVVYKEANLKIIMFWWVTVKLDR